MSIGAVASTTARIGLAAGGIGVGVLALSRVREQTSPGDSPGGGYPDSPYGDPSDRPTSGGDTGGYTPWPSYPTNPGGYVPADPSYPVDPYDPYDPVDPYVPSDPYYPTDPGGYVPGWPSLPTGGDTWGAVSRAAPYSWSRSDVATVASAAQHAGRSSWDAAEMVRQVYGSTPYAWSGSQEAHVAATALLVGRGAYETGRIIDNVEWATPAHWSSHSDVRLAVAALRGGVSSSQVGEIIHRAGGYGSSEQVAVARAEAMLLGGRYGGGYSPLPGYPHTSPDDSY